MESSRIQNKIKLLFKRISEPNYVMNSYYTDSFINKITNTSDTDAANLVALPILPNLLMDALQDTTKYHITVNVFLGRILAIVCRKEQHFRKILEKRRDKLLEYLSNLSKSTNPSLKVAYLEVAMSLITHRTGVCWVLETELWKNILNLYDKSTTVFVLRLMYKFCGEFMWKLNDFDDEANLGAAVGFVLQPVLDINIMNVVVVSTEEEQHLCEKFEPILQMLLSIVAHEDRICYENKVAHFLLHEQSVITHLYILLDRVRGERTVMLISRLLVYMVLLKIFHGKPCNPGVTYSREDFIDLIVMYFNSMHFMIQKGNAISVLDYSGSCNAIWRKVCRNVTLTDSKNLEFEYQVLMIYLVPIYVYVNRTAKGRTVTKESVAQYTSKFVDLASEHTARAAYALRDLILGLDIMSVVLQSVKRLTCIKDHLNDEQANLVFQTLFFALREYSPIDVCDEDLMEVEEIEDSEQKMLVMTYIVDTVLSVVKNYNIKWHESFEVLCLNTVIHHIITKKPNLTCKFVVAALNLLTVTVSKFLPPNLSLLMESQPGSAMHEIGSLIFTKMHDIHWEVRDSALELLNVCTEISYIKFPPLQKQIVEKNLINVAFTMALNDHEPYVQVSALKCVGSASRIALLWEHMKTEHPNLIEQLINILRHNQEGIVRKEACNVLCEVYQTIKLSSGLKQMLYDHIASSAMCDFHWEVQISALRFWKIVIQSLLADQGMLDGTFPPVTFSKESRKIITLNETEVRKILIKLLHELASIGCLTVLLKLLHDDTELDVMEAAYTIAQELQTILVQYKVPENVKHVEGEPKNMADLICHIKEEDEDINGQIVEPESSKRAENVIDGILKTDDMNLLANIYQKSMNLQIKEPLAPKVKLLKTASPYLFVSYMEQTDCKKIINQKRDWKEGIRSISSLLDDVLGIYESNEEFNSLDCY